MVSPIFTRIARTTFRNAAMTCFVKARGVSSRGALALICLIVFAATVHAAPPVRHSISFQGKVAGEQVVTTTDDGRVIVNFSYLNNGRGPDLHEEMRIDEAGRLTLFRVKGKSTYGAPVDESFLYANGVARWKSLADNGEQAGELSAQYVPVENSFEAIAVIARGLLRQPDGKLAALPAGQLSIRSLCETTVQAGPRRAKVALYAIFGFDISPSLLWLRSDESQQFFAAVYPGFTAIESGWEERAGDLLKMQQDAERELLGTLADGLSHRFKDPILIRSVRVFDSDAAMMRGPFDVYVFRGHIASIYPPGSAGRDVGTVIDGEGRFLLPGLFDMHGHEWRWNAMLQIAGGVTTVRDMGNDNKGLEELRTDIENGRIVGPRIVPTGFIEGESPYASRGGIVINTLDEGKSAVDWYAQRGRRQIKLYNSIRPEWVAPLASYAHALGMRVSGHIPAFMRAEEAVRAGYDEIQHINQVMLNFLVKPGDDTRTLLRFQLVGDNASQIDLDSDDAKAFFQLLVSRGTVVDTTITTFEPMFTQLQGAPNPAFQKVASHVPPALQRNWLVNSMDVNAANASRYRNSYAKLLELTRRLYAAGIPLLAGTDNIAGFTLHRELETYVEAGIGASQALQIATRNGAQYTQLSDLLGTVAVGKLADVILVDADPTENIASIRDISMVMKDGVVYYPAEIYEAMGVKPFRLPPKVVTADGTPLR
jgi:hypothetical protein